MPRRTGSHLSIGDILTGQTTEKTVPLLLPPSAFADDEIVLLKPVSGTVRFIATDGGAVGLFAVQTALRLPCSVDGEEFVLPLNLSFSREYRTSPSVDDSPVNPDHTVDVAPALWDEIVVSIPMRPLCPRHGGH